VVATTVHLRQTGGMRTISRLSREPTVTGAALSCVLVAIVAWLQIRRGEILGGDQMIWMHIAHWNALGEPLYSGVWEHKDAGLFLIYRFAEDLGGTIPLRLLGATAAAMSGWGVWRIFRSNLGFDRRAWHHLVAALTWCVFAFSSPSFLYTYTENFAFALFVIGLTFKKSPSLAGIAFGLSCCVKIGFVIPMLFVIAHWLVTDWGVRLPPRSDGRRGHRGTALKDVLSLISSFLLVPALVCLALLDSEERRGWLEVIRYNVYYSDVRREGVSFLRSQIVSVHATPEGLTVAFVVLVALLIVLISLFKVGGRLVQRLTSLRVHDWAFIGIAAMSVMQSPLNLHHWYPLSASALVVIVEFLFEALSKRSSWSPRNPIGNAGPAIRIGLLLAACVLALSSSTLWAMEARPELIDEESVSVALDSRLMNKGTVDVLVIGGNSRYFPLSSDSQSFALQCRFLVWFWWVEDYFLNEMEECFEQDPDLVYVMDDRNLGARTSEFISSLPGRGFSSCSAPSGVRLFIRGRVCG